MAPPADLLRTPFADFYPSTSDEWIDVYGYAVPQWISDPEQEYDAVRTRVAVHEHSMLYKWHVAGPDAVAVVDSVVSRDIRALPPGRLAYGVIVDDEGFMVDDVVVGVHGPELVVLSGGNPASAAALASVCPAGTTVTERRAESAVLSLQGPRSREVLAALTSYDVSNENLPYYAFARFEVAGLPALVQRVGFTAELGYEIQVPVDQAGNLWAAIMAAGQPFGIAPMSAAALMMCRIEAGMVMGELEYDHTTSPFECRMGWAVDAEKGPFRGSEALARRRGSDSGRVMSVCTDADPASVEGRTLTRDSVAVGTITMAVPSPALGGRTLAMARLHRDAAAVGTSLIVDTGDGPATVEVVATPVHDPQRLRVRS